MGTEIQLWDNLLKQNPISFQTQIQSTAKKSNTTKINAMSTTTKSRDHQNLRLPQLPRLCTRTHSLKVTHTQTHTTQTKAIPKLLKLTENQSLQLQVQLTQSQGYLCIHLLKLTRTPRQSKSNLYNS